MDKLIWFIMATSWIIDRFIKAIVQQQFIPGESLAVIENAFHLTYVQNIGAAFGLLAGQRWIFIITALIAVGLIVYVHHALTPKTWYVKAALGMIGGGALGNLYDRIIYGYVVDYIDVRIVWPYIFNFADSMIVLGVGIILLSIILEERKNKKSLNVSNDSKEENQNNIE